MMWASTGNAGTISLAFVTPSAGILTFAVLIMNIVVYDDVHGGLR